MICPDCRIEVPRLETHHLVPKKDGGGDNPENLFATCHYCHQARHRGRLYLKTPEIDEFLAWLDSEHERRIVPLWEQDRKIRELGYWQRLEAIEEAAMLRETPMPTYPILHLID